MEPFEKLKKIAANQNFLKLITDDEEDDFCKAKNPRCSDFSVLNGNPLNELFVDLTEQEERADMFFEGINDFLRKEFIPFSAEKKTRSFFVQYYYLQCLILLFIEVLPENETVNFRAVLPARLKKGCRCSFYKTIEKINRSIEFGAFSADDEGEINFRYSYSFAGEENFGKKIFDKILGAVIFYCGFYYSEKIAFSTENVLFSEIENFAEGNRE